MPAFSLIVPTLGRTEELATLFTSLARQYPASVEVIVVDQNDDDRVTGMLPLLGAHASVQHLRLARKSLANARNVGLHHARGEFVAFPDDDCWYPDNLLTNVALWFGGGSSYDILAVGALDEEGLSSGNRWLRSPCNIRPHNALRTTFSNSLFIRRCALPCDLFFDETMLSSEETDYVLRLMKAGLRGRFDRSLHIGHPRRDMLSGAISSQRATRYGEGMGQLVRRHSLFALWGGLMTYEVLRAFAVAIRGDLASAASCMAHTRGLMRGFWSTQTQRA